MAVATHEQVDAFAAFLASLDDPAQRERMISRARFKAAGQSDGLPETGERVVLTAYSDIEAKTTEWVWAGRVPLGALTLAVGTEGLGKTAFGIRLAADLTTGALPGVYEGQPVTVALVTPEDDAGATIKGRITAAGGNQTRILDLKVKKDKHDRGICLPADTDLIVEALVQADVKVVFADPLASMLDPSKNSWKDTDIRDALEPLVGALAEHGITLLGSLHTNKSTSNDARQRGMGSAGWRQIARSALLIGLDPEDAERDRGSGRCVAHTKCNLGRLQRTVRMKLETATIDVGEVVRADLGEECDVTSTQMLAHEQEHDTDSKQTQEDKASAWLYSQLADGPKAVQAIKSAAGITGFAWRTIERAKADIGIEACQPKGVRGWSWTLPETQGLEV